MKIRMKIGVSGTFHSLYEGVSVGQVVDVDDESANQYILLDYAERVDQHGEEHAVSYTGNEERAVVERVINDPAVPVKRGPGRPRKAVVS